MIMRMELSPAAALISADSLEVGRLARPDDGTPIRKARQTSLAVFTKISPPTSIAAAADPIRRLAHTAQR
jgi:hypothetical protein